MTITRPFIVYHTLRHVLMLGILMLGMSKVYAQAQLNFDYTEGKVFIKGQVTNMKTLAAVPYANIWIPNRHKGITADGEGKFSMYLYPDDTIRCTSLGFIIKTIPIKAITDKERYVMNVQLIEDIYTLKSVTIYPFRNKDEFARAFIKGQGVYQPILVSGISPPKYKHVERSGIASPISAIYNRIKARRSAADPNFKP
jgi:CarboxypepD_reg-like domain